MWETMGASVRGPAHRRAGQPNQDAWLTRRTRAYALAVISDGLGSRPHAAAGSRAACRSVAEAVRAWAAAPGAPPELLLRFIHALWNLRVHALGTSESAATCAFALAVSDGPLLLAQLGDGLVLARRGNQTMLLEPLPERFGNTTTGLGIASDLREWRYQLSIDPPEPAAILLATDGVADDLLPERRSGFLDTLISHYGNRPRGERSRLIGGMLRGWPTPGHRDDKTLVVMWRNDGLDGR
jgi:hypothetical protein